MKFYYTILKISPNTSSGDSVSIGLLAFNKKEAIVSFSESRRILAKKLVSPDLVDFFCKQIIAKVKELNKAKKSGHDSLFNDDFVFEPSYIDYLSNYSNGLLQLSKATVFLKGLSTDNFNLLFETLIDKLEERPASRKKTGEIARIVQEKLINRVKDKVHTNIKLDGSLVPNLYFTYDMDCIGKNGVLVGAKTIDFTNKRQAIDYTISHYNSLIAFLSVEHKKEITKNSFYLIAEEPSTQNTAEYEIWDSIQQNPLFKIINPEQSDVVAKRIEDSKATKFFG